MQKIGRFFLSIGIMSFSLESGYAEISIDKTSLKETTNILRVLHSVDKSIEKYVGRGAMEGRFRNYREILYKESVRDYPIIPHVWSIHPSLDITSLYEPYIQKYSLSCEIAAVRMVMQSFGKRRSEESIFLQIPRYPGPLKNGVWGNPEKEFVGYLTGTQGGKTGFGIYEGPLKEYLRNEGFQVQSNNIGETPSLDPKKELISLLDSIRTGDRVILWGDWCTLKEHEDGILSKGGRKIISYFPLAARNQCDRDSDKRTFSWITTEGEEISALSGEHTFLLLGYIGEREHPSHIIVWDTYTGRHIYPYDEWMRKWKLLDYRYLKISTL